MQDVLADADAIVERIARYVDNGASKFILRPAADGDDDVYEQTRRLVEEALPRMAQRWPRPAKRSSIDVPPRVLVWVRVRPPENQDKYTRIRAFCREHGLDFHPAGTGIGHQIMVQDGYELPGVTLCAVAS